MLLLTHPIYASSNPPVLVAQCDNGYEQFNLNKIDEGKYTIDDLGDPINQGIWIYASNIGCTGGEYFGTCSENKDQIVIKQHWSGDPEYKTTGVFDKKTKQLEIRVKRKTLFFYHDVGRYQFQCK